MRSETGEKMREKMTTCPACGTAALHVIVEDVAVPFRSGAVTVPGVAVKVCAACGERPLSADEAERLHLRAVAIARQEQGLLTPTEIRAIRSKRGLTQRQLEIALGVGEKTVVRWEKGSVFQGAASNTLMGLVRDIDGLAEALMTSRQKDAAVATAGMPQTVRVSLPTAGSISTSGAQLKSDDWCTTSDFLVAWPETSYKAVSLGSMAKESSVANECNMWEIDAEQPVKQGGSVGLPLAA